MLLLIVNIWFQVLFHSPPGVLFTFPSRYYTLSVTRSYLALGDGPPIFTPNSTCSGLLWILNAKNPFRLRDYHSILFCFPTDSTTDSFAWFQSEPHQCYHQWFGLFPVRSPLLGKSIFLSLPPGTKMFQFPGFPSITVFDSCKDNARLKALRFRIRTSTDHNLFAVPRRLSQLVTSFIGA